LPGNLGKQLPTVPRIAWPKKPRSNPATIGPSTQRAILDAIPEEKRAVFLAMALLRIRPSEAVETPSRQLRGDGWITIDVSRAPKAPENALSRATSGRGASGRHRRTLYGAAASPCDRQRPGLSTRSLCLVGVSPYSGK